ncbi:MAG: 4Fe-4S binding protein [Proteobacteria bacterium]|nr:4Fe-4S binding protein [Pseudomonadota bacterium]MBU1688527.1 4Fe-4S binding protein [Pseudomonadota bacterium]
MKNQTHYIGPRRRLFQWTTTVILLLLPWLEVDGKSLLRLDIAGQKLYLFGQILRIQELYLVLLATLIFVLSFLLVTVVLGRVWCGWLCPQTTLSDLAEWTARRLGLTVKHNHLHGPLWRKMLVQGIFLFLAFVVAANLLWYFIPPRHFFSLLLSLDLHYAAWITLIGTGLVVYLDLAVVRRLMCRELCPYGRVQTALVDKATLSLHLPGSELERCLECNSCVRACPMEIDIRDGYQVECTNCGRCLDACRKVMTKQNEPGLIRYTFGLHGEGLTGLLNPRVLLPVVAITALLVTLGFALVDRPVATLKISVSHTAATRQLENDQIGTFFNAWINNRSQAKAVYTMEARQKESSAPLLLKGQVRAELTAGENRRLDFLLVTPAHEFITVELVLKDQEGLELSIAEAYIGKTQNE